MDNLIVFGTKYLYIIAGLAAVVMFLGFNKSEKIKAIRIGIIAGIITLVLVFLAGKIINDPRPFVVDGTVPLIPHPADNGFPSDHTVVVFFLAALIYLFRKWAGITIGLLGLLVGASRVAAHIHHPVDIIGGIIISLASIYASFLIHRLFLEAPGRKC